MGYNTSIAFGSLTLEAASIENATQAGTRKQIIGKEVRVKPIPDRQTKDWFLTIRASLSDTGRNTDRDTLQTMFDNANKVRMVDGLHDGDYYITRLRWLDSSDRPNEHQFIMEVVQEQ
jgi:hypothetical protein